MPNLLNAINGIVCPKCHKKISSKDDCFLCESCNTRFPIINGIPDFREKDEYWCNVTREKMQRLNEAARKSGDWLKAAKQYVPECLEHVNGFYRADSQFIWPIDESSRVLDAGSMWGGLTLPVAQYCSEVFAVDKTMETLQFLKIRAEQMKLNNIQAIASNIKNLPFADNYFDLVILNGVLEWVALNDDLVLELHWGKKRNQASKIVRDPKQIQIDVLREIIRVIKPDGHLILAIENRVGYQYFIGEPDNHVNLRFVSLMPRIIANIVTRWKLNCQYRTYTYSLAGYRKLLKVAGFKKVRFYAAFPHYIYLFHIIPEKLIKYWKNKLFLVSNNYLFRRLVVSLFPSIFVKYISPSFIGVAAKSSSNISQPRLVHILHKAGLLKLPLEGVNIVKRSGRITDYQPAIFLVYDNDDKRPKYFCKVCRNNKYLSVLKDEADNLKDINKRLVSTDISLKIPNLLAFDTTDKITYLVTQFIEGERPEFNSNLKLSRGNLRKLDKEVSTAIRFLVKFQKFTTKCRVKVVPYLSDILIQQKETLDLRGQLTNDDKLEIDNALEQIKKLKDLYLPICAIQGDFELNNLLFKNGEVNLVDFEHYEPQGLPFLDLANIIFGPVLINYLTLNNHNSFASFVYKYNLKFYFKKWLKLYSELSGISKELLSFLGLIGVVEQSTKKYPFYRDPLTYPLGRANILKELIKFNIDL